MGIGRWVFVYDLGLGEITHNVQNQTVKLQKLVLFPTGRGLQFWLLCLMETYILGNCSFFSEVLGFLVGRINSTSALWKYLNLDFNEAKRRDLVVSD